MTVPIVLFDVATDETFDEASYLRANVDVRQAVERGDFRSGRQHFEAFGRREGRRQHHDRDLSTLRDAKLEKLRPHLRLDLPHVRRGSKYDFLTAELRAETRIVETENVSENEYDGPMRRLVEKHRNGLVLDCGAGRRPVYYPNVVNYEIVDYPTTDILGVGEVLPFRDDTFDCIFSVAVLEHVRDPFRCAAEIARVLKPGGDLFCAVPFLQPLHGYPHHYFNATHQGIRRLFEDQLEIREVTVLPSTHPVITLHWILGSYAQGLSGRTRDDFLAMTVADFLKPWPSMIDQPFVTELPMDKQLELACATVLIATKR